MRYAKLSTLGILVWLFSVPAQSGGSTPPDSYEAASVAYEAGDYAKARSIWQPMADKGDMHAQYAIGRLYEKGRGVDRDFATAVKWYRQAAEKGHADSQYRLAVGYGYGLGVKKDETLAVMWLRKAAANGQKRAQKSLAKAYEDGLFGLPRDPAQAKYWYDKASSS